MNNAKVLAYYSVVYGNDNSFILNKNSTCLLYDLAASEKIFLGKGKKYGTAKYFYGKKLFSQTNKVMPLYKMEKESSILVV